MKFKDLMRNVRDNRSGEEWKPPKRILALDPGETVGYAKFNNGLLAEADEITGAANDCNTKAESVFTQVADLISSYSPDIVVMENYKIYQWKTKTHTWSELFTPRLIGAIELACYKNKIPMAKQMASTAKSFCTNDKLKKWKFYTKGSAHARDAVRHGCYYLLFG